MSVIPTGPPALRLQDVTLRHGERLVLDHVDWEVHTGQRWVLVGLNGAGKTSLLRIAALVTHPSSGTVDVLGQRLGNTDVRRLRRRVGFVSQALADRLRGELAVIDVVMTARRGALEPWWDTYGDDDRAAAHESLARLGCDDLAGQRFASLSSGERQRVLLARTLAAEPELLLLDEPTAGLDLAGREHLLGALGRLADDPSAPPTVLVTHHLEEVPPGATHALALRGGQVLAQGAIDDVLSDDVLSRCYGLPLRVRRTTRTDGVRWSATASVR